MGWRGNSFEGLDFLGTPRSLSLGPSTLIIQDPAHGLSSTNCFLNEVVSSTKDDYTPMVRWDKLGSRIFETGLDRGVLYLNDGRVVPWNGLLSVVESSNKESASVYFDGMMISTLVSLGGFSATMKAITYPDEFAEIEGLGKFLNGVYLTNQRSQSFDLSYRTLVGDDLEGIDSGYKIHILYNVAVVPKDKTYQSMGDSISPAEFEWDIVAVPEDIDGYSPTAHIVINSRDLSPSFLKSIETVLYGSNTAFPALPPMEEFLTYLNTLSRATGVVLIQIIDNGDGTWTASTSQDDLIVVDEEDFFEIFNANITFAGDSYDISDTIID